MKKRLFVVLIVGTLINEAKAQISSYDSWSRLPTMDLYDTGTMNAYARAVAETAARRKRLFEYYSDLAVEAYNEEQWSYAIDCVNNALNTQYYSGLVFYIRGYALEQLGDEKAAMKDYKKGKKYGSEAAASALESLKDRRKRK